MIDRMQTPMCVYRSRFAPDTLTQTVTAGLSVNVTEVTREATLDEITRTLDYEAARAVNRLLTPQVALGGDFARRDGRCADGRDENI